MDKKVESYDIAVIGGGAAGMTAAMYCGRARLKTILIEKALPGGLATYTSEVENYPGFPESISGPDLMKLFEKQAKKFGVRFKLAEVSAVNFSGPEKIVQTHRVEYRAKAVIVATGGKPRLTGAINEQNYLFDKGISFCATCDAARFKDRVVLVVGSGDAAIEEALFLTRFASRVIVSVIHDVGVMDANKVAQERAMSNPKMEFAWNTVVHEFRGDGALQEVVLKNVKTGDLAPIRVDGCFLFIGYVPDTSMFKGILDMTPTGYIKVTPRMETNVPGVFAAGDVCDKFLRQVATAVGDGAVAGVAAERYIAEEEYYSRELLGGGVPRLVYCWNPTDAASRELMKVVEETANGFGEGLRLCKVDIYKGESLASRLGLSSAPSFAFIRDGMVVGRVTGGMTKGELESEIATRLGLRRQ